MFNSLRPLLRIAIELKRIADSLEYFAQEDARRNNRMFVTKKKRFGKDESELLHTDDALIGQLREQELARMLQRGYPVVEAEDLIDNEAREQLGTVSAGTNIRASQTR